MSLNKLSYEKVSEEELHPYSEAKGIYANTFDITDKKALKDDVGKIRWLYTLKPSTINIAPYLDDLHDYSELAFLQVELNKADNEVRNGKWLREENRGIELDGKTVGLIGYGNMGKAFAKKLRGFDVTVLCYDIKNDVADENAKQVSLKELQEQADVLSLHTPQTELTINMVDSNFIKAFKKPFWLINTARGKSVVTKDLVSAMQSGKILGAGLDVLEYEKASFENLFSSNMPEAFQYLIKAENVILSPHVAGWTVESKEKLAQTIVDKIKAKFC